MDDLDALVALFYRNFPFVARDEESVRRILGNPDNDVIARRDENGRMIAAAVIHQHVIYMLCVDAAHRRRGIGGELLAKSERRIAASGYREIAIGAGDDYLTPGVPTDRMPYPEALLPARLDAGLNNIACDFLKKRGYAHAWGESNCFDMRLPMEEFCYDEHAVGDTVDGVTYRFAEPDERDSVCRMTDGSYSSFTEFYDDEALYRADSGSRALIATREGEICGALIVDTRPSDAGMGSVGCTVVAKAWRGRHIAAHLVLLGTRCMKENGAREGFLSYTYSGLDKLYGLAGYRICAYYFMARKECPSIQGGNTK